MDLAAVSHHPDGGATGDPALDDVRAGDGVATVDGEDPADLGATLEDLDEGGLVEALDRLLDVIGDLIDHLVVAHVDALRLRRRLGGGVRADVEADHDRVGDGGEVDVGLGDRPHAVGHDLDADRGVVDLGDLTADRLQRAVGLRLDQQVEALDPAVGGLGGEIRQGDPPHRLGDRLPLGGRPLLRQSPGGAFGGDHLEDVAGDGDVVQAGHHHRHAGTGLLHPLAGVGDQGAHRAVDRPRHHLVAHPQGAVLDQDGGDGTAAALEPRIDDGAHRRSRGVGLGLLDIADQEDDVEQVVDALSGPGAGAYQRGGASVLLGNHLALGQLLEDAIGVGVVAVDLVEGDDDGNPGGADVLDRLVGLGHDPVVGGDHQHRDVGDVGAASPHGGEGLVPRGVDEGDQPSVPVDLVGADPLGDAARLAGRHPRLADMVQQRGLAMVDVPEHGNDRRSRRQRLGILAGEIEQRVTGAAPAGRGARRRRVLALRLEAEMVGGQRRGVEVDGGVEGRGDPIAHQVLDHLRPGHREAVGQLLDRQGGREPDLLHRGDDSSSRGIAPRLAARASWSMRSGVVRRARVRARRRRACDRQVVPVWRQR